MEMTMTDQDFSCGQAEITPGKNALTEKNIPPFFLLYGPSRRWSFNIAAG
jgi:hypothetical protein